MKTKIIAGLGVIALIGLLIFSGMRACNLYDKNSILKGQAMELARQLNNQKQLLIESKKDNTDLQTRMDGILVSSEEAISTNTETINTLNGHIGRLRAVRTQLTDSEAIVANLGEQIETQDEIISTFQFTIIEKDKQIFALTKKYISERDLRIDTEKALEKAMEVIQISNLRIKGLETKLRRIRFTGKLKTGVIVGLVAVVIYGLVVK